MKTSSRSAIELGPTSAAPPRIISEILDDSITDVAASNSTVFLAQEPIVAPLDAETGER